MNHVCKSLRRGQYYSYVSKMKQVEEKNSTRTNSILIVFHTIITVSLALAVTHIYIQTTQQLAQQGHAIRNLREMLNKHIHLKAARKMEKNKTVAEKVSTSLKGIIKEKQDDEITMVQEEQVDMSLRYKRAGNRRKQRKRGNKRKQRKRGKKGNSTKKEDHIASAHIVGEGKMMTPYDIIATGRSRAYRITSWRKNHAVGSMHYVNGFIEVGITGYYYIYGQLDYRDGDATMTGFMLCIDNKDVIEASNSVVSEKRKYNTNYIGGVFFVQAKERISMRTKYKNRYYFSFSKTYFGAFLVHGMPKSQ